MHFRGLQVTSNHLPRRRQSYALRLSIVGLTITLGFMIVFGIVLNTGRERERDQAQLAVSNVVTTINADIERNLEIYDLSLQAVADGVKLPEYKQFSPALRQIVLFDRAATARDMGSISILDPNGTVTVNSRTLTPAPENFSDRDFFIVQQKNPNAGPYLSRPWLGSDGEYLIAISRRLSNADGSFAGIVIGTMRLNYFRDLFGKLNLEQGDAVTLIRGDGSLVIRSPFEAAMIGRNVAATRIFRKIISSESGAFEDTSQLDGTTRLYVYQHIGDYPLIIAYGRSVESIYGPWRQRSLRSGLIVVCLCATNVALIIFLALTLRRRRDAEYALAVSATTDGLTGLCNRRRLDELFDLEWRRAMRNQTSIALLMIDADHFKAFNDRFGHQAGDEALASIAGCLEKASRRAGDICARYGGEEFAVLLPGLSLAEAVPYAEMIRSSVTELRSDQQERPDSTPTISIGAAALVPRRGLEPTDLIKAADLALYKAKRNGRNRTEPGLPQIALATKPAAA
jgi:diguanylate cyclase (GGDEF)-like protein